MHWNTILLDVLRSLFATVQIIGLTLVRLIDQVARFSYRLDDRSFLLPHRRRSRHRVAHSLIRIRSCRGGWNTFVMLNELPASHLTV